MPDFEDLVIKLDKANRDDLKEIIEALGDLGDRRAVPHLLKLLESVDEEELIESILWCLSRIADLKDLIQLLAHGNPKVVIEVLDALGRRQERNAIEHILPFVQHKNAEIRAMATWTLGKMNDVTLYNILLDLLKNDPDPEVRAHAAWGIGKYEKIDSISTLQEYLDQETDESVLYNLKEAIEKLENAKDPWGRGVSVTIYECSKHQTTCENQPVQIKLHFDDFIKIEIMTCEICSSAKICKVNLIRKLDS